MTETELNAVYKSFDISKSYLLTGEGINEIILRKNILYIFNHEEKMCYGYLLNNKGINELLSTDIDDFFVNKLNPFIVINTILEFHTPSSDDDMVTTHEDFKNYVFNKQDNRKESKMIQEEWFPIEKSLSHRENLILCLKSFIKENGGRYWCSDNPLVDFPIISITMLENKVEYKRVKISPVEMLLDENNNIQLLGNIIVNYYDESGEFLYNELGLEVSSYLYGNKTEINFNFDSIDESDIKELISYCIQVGKTI